MIKNKKLLILSGTIGFYTLVQRFNPFFSRKVYNQLKKVSLITFLSSFLL